MSAAHEKHDVWQECVSCLPVGGGSGAWTDIQTTAAQHSQSLHGAGLSHCGRGKTCPPCVLIMHISPELIKVELLHGSCGSICMCVVSCSVFFCVCVCLCMFGSAPVPMWKQRCLSCCSRFSIRTGGSSSRARFWAACSGVEPGSRWRTRPSSLLLCRYMTEQGPFHCCYAVILQSKAQCTAAMQVHYRVRPISRLLCARPNKAHFTAAMQLYYRERPS